MTSLIVVSHHFFHASTKKSIFSFIVGINQAISIGTFNQSTVLFNAHTS
jgi:hypothetical protein